MITASPVPSRARVRLPGLPKRKVIRVATGCSGVDQFVATFARYCEADACFVPTTQMRPAGLEAVFALQLANGEPLLRGVGFVMAAWRDAENPFGRPGLFVAFRRLTADSRVLVRRMVALRGAGIARGTRDTIPQPLDPSLAAAAVVISYVEGADSVTPTVAMSPIRMGVPADGVVQVPATSDLTERCVPAFADCEVSEVPRSAIATILGFAPLPKPVVVVAAAAAAEPELELMVAPVVGVARAGRSGVHPRLWMIVAAAFAIAFVIAFASA